MIIGQFSHEFWDFLGLLRIFSFYLVQKKSDVLSWPTYQPTMSDFRPIMLNLPTCLKSDVINGRSLNICIWHRLFVANLTFCIDELFTKEFRDLHSKKKG